jgi:hypothetical protein
VGHRDIILGAAPDGVEGNKCPTNNGSIATNWVAVYRKDVRRAIVQPIPIF